ncbi:NAD-dependent epimerase/dehydratase family protein [Microbacterium sp. P5_E9]
MSTLNWVIGARGLLGSAVTRCLQSAREEVFDGPSIRWATPLAVEDLNRGLEELIDAAADGGWQVLWCAGAGVTGSSAAELQTEVATFEALLASMRSLPAEIQSRGSLFVASSAGAVYAGSRGAPFDEWSEPVPLGEYGRAKLALEAATSAFAEAGAVRCFVGRISNLYGPGQSLSKPQGLISHLSMASVRRTPLSVYVPLDTLRDYIFVDDCAALIVDGCRTMRASDAHHHLKIMASGRSVSIGALLAEFRRIVGRRPEVVMATSPQSALQSVDLRVQSRYWVALDRRPSTNLTDGIARTLQGIRTSYLRGGA